jgi:hypothetical protein
MLHSIYITILYEVDAPVVAEETRREAPSPHPSMTYATPQLQNHHNHIQNTTGWQYHSKLPRSHGPLNEREVEEMELRYKHERGLTARNKPATSPFEVQILSQNTLPTSQPLTFPFNNFENG